MDKLADKLAGMGVSGLVLLILVSTSGYFGAAATTAALAALGGPFGMLGGIATLLLISAIVSVLAKHGIDAVAKAVVQKMLNDGNDKESIKEGIDHYPIISQDLKNKLRFYVEQA